MAGFPLWLLLLLLFCFFLSFFQSYLSSLSFSLLWENFFFLLFFFFFNVYLLLRERDTHTHSASEGGTEREGDTESEAGSRLWAVSTEPNVGLELRNREIMTWAEVWRLTDWDTQAPLSFSYSSYVHWCDLPLYLAVFCLRCSFKFCYCMYVFMYLFLILTLVVGWIISPWKLSQSPQPQYLSIWK